MIVHALLAGEQIIDLRKGGVREDARDTGDGATLRRFGLESSTCWLYPTAEHQREELLRPGYQRFVELSPAAPVGAPITLHGWASVVAAGDLRGARR